jgi:hypothetical protein
MRKLLVSVVAFIALLLPVSSASAQPGLGLNPCDPGYFGSEIYHYHPATGWTYIYICLPNPLLG